MSNMRGLFWGIACFKFSFLIFNIGFYNLVKNYLIKLYGGNVTKMIVLLLLLDFNIIIIINISAAIKIL